MDDKILILKLDPLRLQLVMRKALVLKGIYAAQLEQFVDYLQSL